MCTLLKNISTLYTAEYNSNETFLESETIHNAALVWDNDTIIWIGHQKDLPDHFNIESVFDANNSVVTPGFIDAHTHLCFGGSRQDEFVRKLKGDSYLTIAQEGGGIRSTVKATRAASVEDLIKKADHYLNDLISFGVTSVEAKSGYGLDLDNEIKQLSVYKILNKRDDIDIIPTCLGAHTFPPEFEHDHDGYIHFLIDSLIPEIGERNLAEFFDIFVEDSAFTVTQAEVILSHALKQGFKLKLHVDQLHDGDGARLAATFKAVSADHLEYISDVGIDALKRSGTVPVSLPLASIYINQPPLPARKMLDQRLPVAIATDFNPGSAPSHNIQHAMWLGSVFQRMTPHEVLLAVTNHAAKAIDRFNTIGTLSVGKKADLVILDIPTVDEWIYNYSKNPVNRVFKNGKLSFSS